MDLLVLAGFNPVASHGGFGRASRDSGRPKATLSRGRGRLQCCPSGGPAEDHGGGPDGRPGRGWLGPGRGAGGARPSGVGRAATRHGPACSTRRWPWRLDDGSTVQPEPILRLSSLIMVRDAVRAGAGAALLPRSLVGEGLAAGRLALWGNQDRAVALWVLHSSRRLVSRKVAAFVRFLWEAYPDGTF